MPSGLMFETGASGGARLCLGIAGELAQQQACSDADASQRFALEDAGGAWYQVRMRPVN